jgi:hypothetical protein
MDRTSIPLCDNMFAAFKLAEVDVTLRGTCLCCLIDSTTVFSANIDEDKSA